MLRFFLLLRHYEFTPEGQTINWDFVCWFSDVCRTQPTQAVGLPGWGISLTQGLYLHTGQHKHRLNACKHPCLKWVPDPRCQCSSRQRQFLPSTAQPLWAAYYGSIALCWALTAFPISWSYAQLIGLLGKGTNPLQSPCLHTE
jgi:hypothetical protein